MTTYDLDVGTIRGNAIESRHRVHAAVVDARGALRGRAGDPELVSHWRSCAKPFQVMPLLENGHADRLGWGDDDFQTLYITAGKSVYRVRMLVEGHR